MTVTTDGHRVLSEHEQLIQALADLSDNTKAVQAGMFELARIVGELGRSINEKLASTGERTSSVEVKTSARGEDITTKAYTGSDIDPAGDAAVRQYFKRFDEIQLERAKRGESARG